jgi:hypothetical protein
MLRILGMYNNSAWLILFFFVACNGMSEPNGIQDAICDRVSIPMSKNLFYFFEPKLYSFKSVSKITYDEQTQKATCSLKYKRNIGGLLSDRQLVSFLNSNTFPSKEQNKHMDLVLPAFIKLEQLLNANFIRFNKLQTGVILNPAFAKIQDSDMSTCFESIEQSARICAAVAGIPFLD